MSATKIKATCLTAASHEDQHHKKCWYPKKNPPSGSVAQFPLSKCQLCDFSDLVVRSSVSGRVPCGVVDAGIDCSGRVYSLSRKVCRKILPRLVIARSKVANSCCAHHYLVRRDRNVIMIVWIDDGCPIRTPIKINRYMSLVVRYAVVDTLVVMRPRGAKTIATVGLARAMAARFL